MLLKEILSNVAEFHTAFRIPNADAPHASLTREEALLRHRLMAEENDEYSRRPTTATLVRWLTPWGPVVHLGGDHDAARHARRHCQSVP